jgi:hypothetical protein
MFGSSEWLASHALTPAGPRYIAAVEAHLRRHVGLGCRVEFAEVSPRIPSVVRATSSGDGRSPEVFVTAGLSDRPVRPPPGAGVGPVWVELALCVAPELDGEAPLRLLLEVARAVRIGHASAWYHRTLEVAPRRLTTGGPRFAGVFLGASVVLPEGFLRCDLDDGERIHFLSLYPLHRDELELYRRRGPYELIDRLEARGITDLLDPAQR